MDYWVRFVNGCHRGIPQRVVARDFLGHWVRFVSGLLPSSLARVVTRDGVDNWVRFVSGVVGRGSGLRRLLGMAGVLEAVEFLAGAGGEWLALL